jgi:hypothetical protein
LVTLWAWLTRLPNWGPRPQISHTFAIKHKSPDPVERLSIAEARIVLYGLGRAMSTCPQPSTMRRSLGWEIRGYVRTAPYGRGSVRNALLRSVIGRSDFNRSRDHRERVRRKHTTSHSGKRYPGFLP